MAAARFKPAAYFVGKKYIKCINWKLDSGARFFGEFKCNCSKTWNSGYAWQGYKQDCRSCNASIMPSRVWDLKGGGDKKKPHDVGRCGKCKTLGPGRSCVDSLRKK